MTLHIFNPEHDLALASGLANFTSPHAGRQLRHDLGFLPALWAADGDAVLVDDVEQAKRAVRRRKTAAVHFVDKRMVGRLPIESIEPWGWDAALAAALRRCGVADTLLPSVQQLDTVRLLSHRRTAANVLARLMLPGTVGESFECTSVDEVEATVGRFGRVVLKAPWSSSGRGLRFVSATDKTGSHSGGDEAANDSAGDAKRRNDSGWLRHVLALQGSVMVEPFYDKVKDFGMEFRADGHGHVTYEGLSLFHTANGAYTGNLLATERTKQKWLCRYIPAELLNEVRQALCSQLSGILGPYRGPFGVDMMVVKPQDGRTALHSDGTERQNVGLLLHPCVEINLRRTMGHVALALMPDDDEVRRVMRIDYDSHVYKLRIRHVKN